MVYIFFFNQRLIQIILLMLYIVCVSVIYGCFLNQYYRNQFRKMWDLAEHNKVISQKMKLISYQKHRQSLKKIKPGIRIQQPWKPSFSLSKRLNKYHKFVENEIVKHNENLLSRMLKIQTQPMKNTINIIPRTIPSNKLTFLQLKQRQRKAETNGIRKENMKIIDRIQNANSQYNSRTLSSSWKENMKYRDILVKKECVPDYLQLVKEYQKLQKSRISRPRTAFVPSTLQNQESQQY